MCYVLWYQITALIVPKEITKGERAESRVKLGDAEGRRRTIVGWFVWGFPCLGRLSGLADGVDW